MENFINEDLQRQILMMGLKDLKKIDYLGTIGDLTKTRRVAGRKCLVCRVA
jgi:hypothetical protein